MQLTTHTDYAIRLLIYLAVHDGKSVTTQEVAEIYNISRNHLTKVVHELVGFGWLEATRGRGGGVTLAMPAKNINLGKVVRQMETWNLVECYNEQKNNCLITSACGFRKAIREAQQAFLAALDKYSLADMIKQPRKLARILAIPN